MSCLIAANCLPYLPRCYWWVSIEVEWTGFVITVISSCNFLKSLWNLLLFSIEANSNLFIAFIIFLKIANLVSDEGIQVQSWNLNMMENSLNHKIVLLCGGLCRLINTINKLSWVIDSEGIKVESFAVVGELKSNNPRVFKRDNVRNKIIFMWNSKINLRLFLVKLLVYFYSFKLDVWKWRF